MVSNASEGSILVDLEHFPHFPAATGNGAQLWDIGDP
jgi:hypothetical protein